MFQYKYNDGQVVNSFELINEKAFITYCNVINNKAEEIKHLKVLVENKNAYIETLERKLKIYPGSIKEK